MTLRRVELPAIERELAALSEKAQGTAEGISRACQLNLLVCCRGVAQARDAEAVVASISAECPSRAIVTVVDESTGQDRLEAAISAHCAVGGAQQGQQVCCEQITLTGSGRGVERLPRVVLPLLLPDLPVAVWYPEDPGLTEKSGYASVARALAGTADRVVMNARGLHDAWRSLLALASLETIIADLSWQRLRGWREMTATFFDSHAFEAYPARLSRLRVAYAVPFHTARQPHPHAGAAEAILLACWAASRLQWRPAGVSDGACTLERPHGAGTAELALVPEPSARPAGQVIAFVLESPDATFRLERSEVLDCVTSTVTIPETCPVPRSARVAEREDGELLCRALGPGADDAVYAEALGLAAGMAASLVKGEPR
ncbi:MAG: glucose-6-phosphate dehydrogenase assembly protein OpcA [Candidatus Polarisedimenticolia bacterium]